LPADKAILSAFDFDIEFIEGGSNSLPDFFTREFLQRKSDKILSMQVQQ